MCVEGYGMLHAFGDALGAMVFMARKDGHVPRGVQIVHLHQAARLTGAQLPSLERPMRRKHHIDGDKRSFVIVVLLTKPSTRVVLVVLSAARGEVRMSGENVPMLLIRLPD